MVKLTLFTLDPESMSEMLANEIKIVNDTDLINHFGLISGTYTAKEVCRIQANCNPNFVKYNETYGKTIELPTPFGFKILYPRDNIFYLIDRHEHLLGLKDEERQRWEAKGKGRCVAKFDITLPAKWRMRALGDMLQGNPDKKQFLAISVADGILRYYDRELVCQAIACTDYTPSPYNDTPTPEFDNLHFGFYPWQAENLYGKCKLKFYKYQRSDDPKGVQGGVRLIIETADGWRTCSDTTVPERVVELLELVKPKPVMTEI